MQENSFVIGPGKSYDKRFLANFIKDSSAVSIESNTLKNLQCIEKQKQSVHAIACCQIRMQNVSLS